MSRSDLSLQRVLLAGHGDLGGRVAQHLQRAGTEVFATSRNAGRIPAPIHALEVDWTQGQLPDMPRNLDACVIALAPDQRTEDAYREVYLHAVARIAGAVQGCLRPHGRVLFVSSTAVYAQQRGEWVDEDSATQPTAFNGRILLEAEQQVLRRFSLASNLRLSGLYGPGRHALVRRAQGGGGGSEIQKEPALFTNRIHIDDAAHLIVHLLQVSNLAPTYVGSDSQPAPLYEVLSWLAGQLDCTPPQGVDADRDQCSQGKRCSNRRIRESGFSFAYPDYRQGYAQVLAADPRIGNPDAT